jgi:hypothetical protein
VKLLWKSVWRLLKKLKIDPPYDPAIPFLGTYLKECKSTNKTDTCAPMFTTSPFTIAKL